ncbi:MAG: CBS domain-containing protein [Isosphaeraceae bacterium]|nr:CBS domain-containing protein [Isosphaeraceae bacterium]
MGASNPGPIVTRADLRNPDLTAADVMRTDFRSCNASAPALEVATALRVSGSPLLPVTRAQVPIGIVTEHGLAMALAEHGGDLSSLTAGDLMGGEAPTIPIKAPIEEVIGRLAEAGGHLLAVNSEGLLKGVVTLSELGPQLSEAALGRLVARLAEGSRVPAALGHGAPAPAEAARAADPTAEIKSSKSQAQPHPWDSPTKAHPEPVPLVSPADLVNPKLTVADAMTADPRTCSSFSTALEAVLIFRDADCGVVPVVDDGRPVGVLTDRDVALALAEHENDLTGRPVGELMTRDVVTIAADAPLDAAIERLGDRGLRRLLVVDPDGRLVGILSWTDLVPHLSERGVGHAVGQIVDHR